MIEYCETFKGGYCERCNKHVPRSWCLNRCKGEPTSVAERKPEPKKQEPPTITQMLLHFMKAMVKWSKEGFAVVSRDEYVRRRTICFACTEGRRTCPKCGCQLWAKVALVTESCEKWQA
jgi:hypothetical protein